MSARNHQPLYAPLRLSPRPSRCLLVYELALHALAGVAVFSTRLSALWVAALTAVLGLSLAQTLRNRRRSPSGRALSSAVWLADDQWRLEHCDGRDRPLRRWDAPVVHPRLVILRFWQDRLRFRCLWLCPDSLDGEQMRRLRVRLRRYSLMRRSDHASH